MIDNPYAGSPSPSQGDAWSRGWLAAFADSTVSIDPPVDIDPNDGSAYSEGVQAGRQSAIDGIEPGNVCISAAEPSPGEELAHLISGGEALHAVWELRELSKLAGGVAGLVVVLIEVGSSAKHALPPESVLPGVADPLLSTLADYGFSNLQVFAGAGIDALDEGCEMKLSNLYPSFTSAHDAVVAMGRPEWVVVSWRTDQCGSFQVVSSS